MAGLLLVLVGLVLVVLARRFAEFAVRRQRDLDAARDVAPPRLDTVPGVEPPIIVAAEGDVDAYRSLEAAAGYMEAIDVLDGVYRGVYDSTGLVLSLIPNERTNAVTIVAPADARRDPDTLADEVRRYVAAVGPARMGTSEEALTEMDLAQLVRLLSAWELRG